MSTWIHIDSYDLQVLDPSSRLDIRFYENESLDNKIEKYSDIIIFFLLYHV